MTHDAGSGAPNIANGPYPRLTVEEIDIWTTGFEQCEAVVVDRDGNLYGGQHDGTIRKLAPDGTMSDFTSTGGRPLGMAFDGVGDLYICDLERCAVLRASRSGEDVTVFAEQVDDVRLWLPNFCVFDDHGNLYVSNSNDEKFTGQRLYDGRRAGSVVRVRPDGTGDVVMRHVSVANGLAIDPAQEALYVLSSGDRLCYRVELDQDDGHGVPEVYATFDSAPDGMAFDTEGYLVVTLPTENRLVVVDPQGRTSTLVQDPTGRKLNHPTNCAFGGPRFEDLFVASLKANHVARLPVGRKGHPLLERA